MDWSFWVILILMVASLVLLVVASAKREDSIAHGTLVFWALLLFVPVLFYTIFRDTERKEIKCKEYQIETVVTTKGEVSDTTYVIKIK